MIIVSVEVRLPCLKRRDIRSRFDQVVDEV